jgi:DNA helicase-2/ATP-dependent DNA helicase PcrA
MLHGQTRYNLRSRFFDELPQDALKWITPKRQGFSSGAGFTPSGAIHNKANYAEGESGKSYFSSGHFSSKSAVWSPSIHGAAEPSPPQRHAGASGPNAWVRSGKQVFHNKFGEGTVLAMEGTGDDARAQINFARHGVKWLALSVAKLTPV